MCVCACICVCTNVHVLYGAHIIISMYTVHIHICSSPRTHTSIHTKWFDKRLTPKAGNTFGVKHLSNHLVCMLLCLFCMCVCACIYNCTCMCLYICSGYNYFNVECVCICDIHKHILTDTKWFNNCLMVCMLACLDRVYDIYRMLI